MHTNSSSAQKSDQAVQAMSCYFNTPLDAMLTARHLAGVCEQAARQQSPTEMDMGYLSETLNLLVAVIDTAVKQVDDEVEA